MKMVRGFTLIELVLTMVIVGIVSVGFVGLINYGSQVYSHVTVRDQLVSDARFVMQRMTREIQNALPNSVRINSQCIEFLPIRFTTVYLDIPVNGESAASIEVIDYSESQNYIKNNDDRVVVYPTNLNDGYALANNKSQQLSNDNFVYDSSEPTLTIGLNSSTTFASESPNESVFVVQEPVSFCIDGSIMTRYSGYGFLDIQPGIVSIEARTHNQALMAEYIDSSQSLFSFYTDSGLVKLNLAFSRQGESLLLNDGVNVFNVP